MSIVDIPTKAQRARSWWMGLPRDIARFVIDWLLVGAGVAGLIILGGNLFAAFVAPMFHP